MKESLNYYPSATGVKTARRTFASTSPGESPCAGLVLVHGLGEHTGRYTAVMEELTAPGILVAGVDLPGHGLSEGKRGHIDSLQTVHDLIDETIEYLRGELPDKDAPIGVFGHSMGGLLVLDYLLEHPDAFTFAWINSPPLNPRHGRSLFTYILARVVAPIWPSLTIHNGIDPTTCFESDDPETIAKATENCHRRISVRLGMDLIRAAEKVTAHAGDFDPELRLLMTQGEPDMVCPPEYTKAFFEALTIPHKTWRLFPGILHECWRAGEVVDAAYGWLTHTIFSDESRKPSAATTAR